MNSSNVMTRCRNQVYSVGNYLMTGKVLGKGHFARVEEATHRVIGKKVAIKIIDLTCIKEEYARRNLHREPRVMAKLRHPCIAALYETMMHGPRLYVVMEAAGGGDLCTHVLSARGNARGLSEARARSLAVQLVSAVRHMHSRGVVHRDLKMENIMLDHTKQYIKIVDFGLSNLWSAGGALRTPCGSLEYAAPELFVDGRRYGPEVDLWSIGVIVFGMVTGGLPFTGSESSDSKSRPQLRAAITKGFSRKQRSALACVTNECKVFIQHLLEPNVEARMKIEDAARHRWLKKPGMKMKTHPLGSIEPEVNREIYRQISELCGRTFMDVIAEIKADPFGAMAGIYNIKTHLHQTKVVPGVDLLWSSNAQEPRPTSPPEYPVKDLPKSSHEVASCSNKTPPPINPVKLSPPKFTLAPNTSEILSPSQKLHNRISTINTSINSNVLIKPLVRNQSEYEQKSLTKVQEDLNLKKCSPSPRATMSRPMSASLGFKKPSYNMYENGDCGFDPRLPSITEHSSTNLIDTKNTRYTRSSGHKEITRVRKINVEEKSIGCSQKVNLNDDRSLRFISSQNRIGEAKRTEFYRRAGDAQPSWRGTGTIMGNPPPRILLQSTATTIKRASLGNIVSPHSSSNSHCKSERALPGGWCSSRLPAKDPPLQRLRRTAPMK